MTGRKRKNNNAKDHSISKKLKCEKKLTAYFDVIANDNQSDEDLNDSGMETEEDKSSSSSDNLINQMELTELTKYIEHQKQPEQKRNSSEEDRKFLEKYPKYKNKNIAMLDSILENFEKQRGDYFGDCFSDDSDSEDESDHQKLDQNSKRNRIHSANELIRRAAILPKAKIMAKTIYNSKEEEIKKPKKAIHQYITSMNSRQKIYRSRIKATDEMKEDLRKLNDYVSRDELTPARYSEIKTKFVIPQFRGIHSYTDKWIPEERREKRKNTNSDIRKAIYSYAAKIESQENPDKIQKYAEEIRDRLLMLQLSGKVRIPLQKKQKKNLPGFFLFDNALIALQNYYTNSYERCNYSPKSMLS